jgi:isoleucyl-tRNA synthetase
LDDVTAFYSDYEPTKAVRAIEDFVDRHLSNWYVRLCRRRFWRGEMTDDKRAAYETLYECLSVVAQLMSPVAPFFAEWLYRNLHTQNTGKEAVSVHLSLLPTANKDLIDPALEERMEYAQGISSLVLSLRKRERIRVRQPLGRMLLPVLNADFREQVDLVKELILQEVNVKAIEYITDTAGVVEKSIKPNFRILGKKVGKNMKAAGEAIAMLSQSDITTFEKMGEYEINLEGAPFKLVLEDVEIISKDIPGWLVANDNHLTVALDVTLTDDLVAEGTARELINRIQNLRKQRDYVVTDRIHITIEPHPLVKTAAEKFTHYICEETLATSLTLGEAAAGESIDLTDDAKIMLDIALN